MECTSNKVDLEVIDLIEPYFKYENIDLFLMIGILNLKINY
jgi:hypothetical protein